MIKTHTPKVADIQHDWFLVDAKGQTLGRLASQLATRLLGKHKPDYSPHLDMADNLVVINATQIKVTGNKLADKKYFRHSGYPGGIKETSLQDKLKANPAEVIELAVKRMLPANRLRSERLKHLKVYPSSEHGHGGQAPKELRL